MFNNGNTANAPYIPSPTPPLCYQGECAELINYVQSIAGRNIPKWQADIIIALAKKG